MAVENNALSLTVSPANGSGSGLAFLFLLAVSGATGAKFACSVAIGWLLVLLLEENRKVTALEVE